MAEADRISALPVDIKVSILSRLVVKDAVRTSALARSWRHLWTLLPCLRLGYVGDKLGVTTGSRWLERVHHLVSSLKGPLVDLELFHSGFHSLHKNVSPLIHRLLDLLLQKGGLEKLSLYIETHGQPPVLIHLPYFPHLKVLRLDCCHLVLPAGFQGFNRLTTLTLKYAKISNDDLHVLIHTSPNLTTLSMFDIVPSTVPLSLNISMPLLKYLEFRINVPGEKVSVISAPSLEEAHFNYLRCSDGSLNMAQATLRLVMSVATVSTLNLSFDVLKYFSLVTLPCNFTFPRLRCLKLSLLINANINKRTHDAFIWFLRSMPLLEELELLLSSYTSLNNRAAIQLKDLLAKNNNAFFCLNQTLKTVRINTGYLDDVITGITLVKFFLLNAKVLKLMKIACWESYGMQPSFQARMIEEMPKVEVSSDAKVIFEDITAYEYYSTTPEWFYDWN
ncbi:F-box family protein [Rhynchospora pubera]|uniref:F-box family protein n=1 Tax=Rhynchospora pubera TaxID=906938 RepID=A0AAV8DF80_9POAL|nr:F-box family protein [Rhynchospora pubera]